MRSRVRCSRGARREAGIVYSLAYGDQPALICEMVDWARAAGFEVVAAGKGTKYLPRLSRVHAGHRVGPLRFQPEMVAQGDFNAQMFNSFLDGTKSAIEMAAVANATGLTPAPGRARLSAVRRRRFARVLRSAEEGGLLHHRGQVEVVSSLERDGRPVARDLRWGVYVTFRRGQRLRAPLLSGVRARDRRQRNYSAMYKPYHLIGLELGISVASVGLRREPTGADRDFAATSWRSEARSEGRRQARRRRRLYRLRQA